MQMIFHHVVPLAMPGMLTGTIIGMAQALGETAPLLMIGMVAFIVDVPGGLLSLVLLFPCKFSCGQILLKECLFIRQVLRS